jgi:hypothetical protein
MAASLIFERDELLDGCPLMTFRRLADYFVAYTMHWLSRINCGHSDLSFVVHHFERDIGPMPAQP